MAERTVSTRYIPFQFTVPKATPAAAPLVAQKALGDVTLLEWHLIVPSGHAGLTGIALQYSGTRIVPWDDPASWIIANGDHLTFDIGFDVSGNVAIPAYNVDVLPHSFYMRFKVTDWPAPTARARTKAVIL